jgi:hypothetical protein
MNHDAVIVEIARVLACYWRDNPNAADGTAGIARWWLPPGHAYADTQVEVALSLLVQAGLVAVSQAADRRVRYALRQGQLGALAALCESGVFPIEARQVRNGGI